MALDPLEAVVTELPFVCALGTDSGFLQEQSVLLNAESFPVP